jgi:hypothetical protein
MQACDMRASSPGENSPITAAAVGVVLSPWETECDVSLSILIQPLAQLSFNSEKRGKKKC